MEQFGVLIIFALIAVFQLLVRWLRRRAAVETPPTPVPEPARTYQPPAPDDEELFVRVPLRPPAPERPTPPAPERVDVLRRPRGCLLGSRGDIRRAIVLMEVLGPSRGMAERGPTAYSEAAR